MAGKINPTLDRFEDARDGSEFTVADFDDLVDRKRGQGLGERVPQQPRSGGGIESAATAGRTTLERASFTSTLLRGTRQEQSRLLARFGGVGSKLLNGILYSRKASGVVDHSLGADVRFKRVADNSAEAGDQFVIPKESLTDTFIRKIQDKFFPVKRAIEAILAEFRKSGDYDRRMSLAKRVYQPLPAACREATIPHTSCRNPDVTTTSLLSLNREIDRLAGEVGLRLKQTGIKLATAESCTGGWVAQAITAVAGSSAWFERGYVTYSNESKIELLNVEAETLAQHGAVSEAVVKEMALGAVKNSRAHLSVAISGIAGPEGGTPDKPVGTVWLAWGQKRGYAEAEVHRLSGDRAMIRARAVVIALDGLRQRLS